MARSSRAPRCRASHHERGAPPSCSPAGIGGMSTPTHRVSCPASRRPEAWATIDFGSPGGPQRLTLFSRRSCGQRGERTTPHDDLATALGPPLRRVTGRCGPLDLDRDHGHRRHHRVRGEGGRRARRHDVQQPAAQGPRRRRQLQRPGAARRGLDQLAGPARRHRDPDRELPPRRRRPPGGRPELGLGEQQLGECSSNLAVREPHRRGERAHHRRPATPTSRSTATAPPARRPRSGTAPGRASAAAWRTLRRQHDEGSERQPHPLQRPHRQAAQPRGSATSPSPRPPGAPWRGPCSQQRATQRASRGGTHLDANAPTPSGSPR